MINMLHNPLFDYNAALSHFLEVRRQRQQHEYTSNGSSLGGLCSSVSGSDTGAESLSPSPPAMINNHSMVGSGKSFTIDAILGHRHVSNSSPTSMKRSSNSNLETVLDFSNSGTFASSSNKRCLENGSDKSDDGSSHTKSLSSGGKSKRVRTIFTPEQLERLETEFERQQYMVGSERLYLAHTLQLTEAQVKVWFQNRRIKWRKQHLEITQQRLALLKQHRQQRMLQQQQQQMQIDQDHRRVRKSSTDDTANDSSESMVVNDYHHHHHHFQSRRTSNLI